MEGVKVLIFWLVISMISSKYCEVESKELSLIRQRLLRDSLGAGSNLKKIIVDLETDVVSAISPISLSGTRYPWRVFSPAVAQAQYQALVESDQNRRRSFDAETYAKSEKLLSSDINEVKFYVYQNHKLVDDFKTVDLTRGPVSQGIYQVRPNEQVKILIHGFQSGPKLPFAWEAKNAYLQETNHSVIVVDWEGLSLPKSPITLLLYPAVTANALKVGEKVASLVEYLLERRVITDLNQVHIIGHSLGAHAAGNAGSLIASKYGKKIGRITALDAAFLAFIGPNVKLRIDKNDAKFVDAIHTSGIGVYDPIGHVDFYPNGGRNQVSCYEKEQYQGSGRRGGDDHLTRTFEKFVQSCSHARAYHFFIKTIKKRNIFWACKCVNWKDYRTFCRDSCAHREQLGEYVSPTARGKYFLDIDV